VRALVTGAAGFVGQWLCQELLRRGWDVTGTRLSDAVPPGALAREERGAVHWIRCDVTRDADLATALDRGRPDAIFHLAGVSFVPTVSEAPAAALDVNVVATARLLSDVTRRRAAGTLDPTVLVIGSGEQYGRHPAQAQPLDEQTELRPLNAYAASKAAQELVALAAQRHDGVRVVATRSFNHSGPGQDPRFLLPALVQRALMLRATGAGAAPIGNTSAIRDFLHVADVVRAYVLLVERGTAGEVYNVASGTGIDVATLASRVLALGGVDAKLQVDASLVRPVEVPMLVGAATKLRAATGWTPERSLDSIILDLLRATTR
jgi:GDP-4-dehydro-6-deoxy-D-mannose reductase